jgi:putative transposase
VPFKIKKHLSSDLLSVFINFVMRLSFKYRIFLNKIQLEELNSIFKFCNFLYNSSLQEKISHYKKYKKGLSYFDQCKHLPEIKVLFPEETKNIHSQSLQFILKTVDNSYKLFFRKFKNKSKEFGYPRYKPLNRFKSICFPQCNLITGGVKLFNNKLIINGISGEIKVKFHRPFKGRCKTVQIKKEGNNFYIILSCENVQKNILSKTNKTIALDLGIEAFITTDDGHKVYHPKPYKTAKDKLKLLNQKLALKQKDSINRRKAISALQKCYTKITNIRNDWQHKVANDLIKQNDIIIVEKLNIKVMLESKGFEVKKSNITDASWGNFVSLLKYKAESAGREIIEVDPRNTSKICSCCGELNKDLNLSNRTYYCDSCKITIDRDQNAALNIRRLGTSLAINDRKSFISNVTKL